MRTSNILPNLWLLCGLFLLAACNVQSSNKDQAVVLTADDRLASSKSFAQDFKAYSEDILAFDPGLLLDFSAEGDPPIDMDQLGNLIDSMNAVLSFLGDAIFEAAIDDTPSELNLWPTIPEDFLTDLDGSNSDLSMAVRDITYSLKEGNLKASGFVQEVVRGDSSNALIVEFELDIQLPDLPDNSPPSTPYSYALTVNNLDFHFEEDDSYYIRTQVNTTSTASVSLGVDFEDLLAAMGDEASELGFEEILDGLDLGVSITGVSFGLGDMEITDAGVTLLISNLAFSNDAPSSATVSVAIQGKTVFEGTEMDASIVLGMNYEATDETQQSAASNQLALTYQVSFGLDTDEDSLWVLFSGTGTMNNFVLSDDDDDPTLNAPDMATGGTLAIELNGRHFALNWNAIGLGVMLLDGDSGDCDVIDDDDWCVEPLWEDLEFSLALTSAQHPHVALVFDPSAMTEIGPRREFLDDGNQIENFYSVVVGRLTVQGVEEAKLLMIETAEEGSLVVVFNADDEEVTLISSSQLYGEPH